MATDWNFLDVLNGEEIGHQVDNCFICDLRTDDHSKLLHLHQSESAVRERLRERLEGVLAVSLSPPPDSGDHLCIYCKAKLLSIETLTLELRMTFKATLRRCRAVIQGCEDAKDLSETLLAPREDLDSDQLGFPAEPLYHPPAYYLPNHSLSTFKLRDQSSHMVSSSVGDLTVKDATSQVVCAPESSDTNHLESPELKVQSDDIDSHITPKDLDSEEPGIQALDNRTVMDIGDIPTQQNSIAVECSEVHNPSGTKERKRKSTVPQRAKQEDWQMDISGDENNLKEDFAPDDDSECEPQEPAKRKRGRPKGSKNKSKLIKPVRKYKQKGRKHRKGNTTPELGDADGEGGSDQDASGEREESCTCDVCGKVFANRYKLNRHKLSHSDERPFKCTKCSQKFKVKYHLERHLQVHSGVRPHCCEVCGTRFRERHQLSEHKLLHTGEMPYACDQCELRFNKASSLKLHMFDHTGNWPFLCQECKAGFVREAELKEHMTMHTGEKPHKCEHCGESFRLANTLKVHLRRHTGLKPYKCVTCGVSFAAANTLKEHHRTHSGERKFLCDTCGASFVHQSGLVQHAKTHLPVEDRKHACQFCKRRFTERALLRRHLRVHTNERPYMCSKCGKAFRRPGELSMHNRYHSNDRRYSCAHCGKSFFTRSHLKRHEATHSGGFHNHSGSVYPLEEAPMPMSLAATIEDDMSTELHTCVVCSKQFQHFELLTRHYNKAHQQPVLTLEEEMSRAAVMGEFSHSYQPEDLSLSYMQTMPIIS